MKTNRITQIGTSVLVGLASIVGNAGCSQVQSPMTPPGAVRQEELHRDLGIKVERIMLNKDGGHFVEDGILYVDAPHYQQAAKEYGVQGLDKLNFQGLWYGDSLSIRYRNSKTGEIVSSEQIVPNTGSIDTLDFGRVKAAERSLDDIDADLEKIAKEKGITDSVEVIQSNAYTHAAAPYSFVIGQTNFVDVQDGKVVSGRVGLPQSIGKLMAVNNVGRDSKYAIVAIPKGNFSYKMDNGTKVLAWNVPEGKEQVRGMMVVADARKAGMGDIQHNITTGHNYYVMFVGNGNHWRLARRTLAEVGGMFNDLKGATDSIREADRARYQLENREEYYPAKTSPNATCIQQAGKELKDLQGVTGGLKTIKGDLEALQPGD
jgi:hypothetical protein